MSVQGKAFVLDGHTLGVVKGRTLQILRASIMRGSPYPDTGVIEFDPDRMPINRARPATAQDFLDFNVMFNTGYAQGSGFDKSVITHEKDRLVFRNPKGDAVLSIDKSDANYQDLLSWFNSWD